MAPDEFRAKVFDVFVSYRRTDAGILHILVKALETAGLSVWWDAKLVHGEWRMQLNERLQNCKLVIALWSEQSATSNEMLFEMSIGRGHDRLMLVKIDRAEVPSMFADMNFLPLDDWADPEHRQSQLETIVAEVRRRIVAPVFYVPSRPATASLVAPPEFGDIPGAPDMLIGRDAELEMLRSAWTSKAPRKVNAVLLHGLGGSGKSAIMRTFANELLSLGGEGAARIYGWSAYSQGSGEQKRADADGFISKALSDFSFGGELPRDPVERARELARLIQKERVLLLLDGLEPLQDAPNLNRGRFKDKGLAELVKMLADQNAGLMVLTTRQEVDELERPRRARHQSPA